MELSSPKIKKLPIFQEGISQAQKIKHLLGKNFLYIFFSKKVIFLYFEEWNFPAQSLKNSNIFSKKNFLHFRRKPENLPPTLPPKKILSSEFTFSESLEGISMSLVINLDVFFL